MPFGTKLLLLGGAEFVDGEEMVPVAFGIFGFAKLNEGLSVGGGDGENIGCRKIKDSIMLAMSLLHSYFDGFWCCVDVTVVLGLFPVFYVVFWIFFCCISLFCSFSTVLAWYFCLPPQFQAWGLLLQICLFFFACYDLILVFILVSFC